MKVVLFCGGLGTRLREHSDTIPKPLVNIGVRPILWHLMRYYAHYGHKDFILCLGYRGELVREFFLNYNECLSNDFVMSEGGKKIELLNSDIRDWRVTFVDTGLHANLGQRLLAARRFLKGENEFLANYSDGLANVPLDTMIEDFRAKGFIASFAAIKPTNSFHTVDATADGVVRSVGPMTREPLLVNGGFFVMKQEIYDYVNDGEELVDQPFARLAAARKLGVYRHEGFWKAMDTLKDKIEFDRMAARGESPWMVWTK
jgi:glucose-1-phosphate cytidylyltransferase